MPLITANQLAVGFFNIAAGGYTAEANANIAANEALAANSYINLPISLLNPQIGGSNVFLNDEFASNLVSRLMPASSPSLAISLNKFVVNYMAANPTMGRGQVAIEMIKAVVAISPADAVLSAAAAPFKAKLALADASTSTSKDLAALSVVVNGSAPAPITTFNFTTLAGETLTGTASDDIFNARILDNANTAQSGDKIDGGAGNDRMNLDIGNSQNFSITLESTGVEQVAVRAQAVGVDTSNNNISNNLTPLSKTNPGQISSTLDAQRMVGVTQWESNNSRGDVIIEDVRIASGNATKTVTIAMVETDPGNVDFAVYFNQLSLRNTSSGTGTLNVFLMDTAAANDPLTAATPLLNQNFNSYTFFNNGVRIVLGGTVANGASAGAAAAGVLIDNAQTYAQLAAAFTEALKFANVGGSVSSTPAGNQVVVGGAVQDLSSAVTATLSAPQNLTTAAAASTTSASVAASFLNLTGQILVLTASNSVAISNQTNTPGQAQGGWAAAGTAPSTGAIVQTFNSGSTTSGELVTSKIILDDVGMGSTGGDLVVGGMSVGETSDSRGVERFEIEVRDNSRLQTINGTNNALREVTIVNGVTDNVNRTTATSTTDSAYRVVTANAGDLTVNGNANTATSTTAINTGSDTILKGVNSGNTTINGYAADHHAGFGFTDVRLIDASAMAGNLAFRAQITTDSIAKYITRVDTAANPASDVAGTGNVNFNVAGANFIYTGGAGNDTMVVAIDGNAAGSRSSLKSGQSDFTFNVAGGAGNDTITVTVVGGTLNQGGLQNWAANQDLNNNITISGGAGNDTIRTPGAGDVIIDGGDGNDTVYTDNTGRQTVATLTGAVLGATESTTLSNARWVFNTFDQVNAVANGAARNLNDLRSDANNSTNFYKGTVTVTFKDIPSVAITLANAVTYKATDLEINQAIKQAINLDPTLSKLLIAQDGPGNTLVVSSLIDGVMSAADLTVAFAAAPATTVFSSAEISGMAIAYGSLALTTNALALAAQVLPSTARTDYATALAQDSVGVNIVGAASTSTSDNFITPGTGNDIIVLGTTVGVDAPRSSNEVITFAAGFGDDVIVNFAATGFGADHLNFAAFLTQGTPQTATAAAIPAAATTVGALSNTDNLVTVVSQAATVNDTTALVTAIIKAAIDGAVQAAATKQIYVVVTASNVGTVYSVVNGTAVGDVVVTREGSIDLADTQWTTLTAASLTGVGAQVEGASSAPIAASLTAVVANQVLVGTPGIDTLSNGGFANITMTGLASGDTFNVSGLFGSATITDLATGDVVIRTGGVVTAGATSATGVSAFVATSDTTTNGVATNFVINSLTAGSTINMAAASVTAAAFGYTLNGSTGVDNLTGSAGSDVITTAGGADVVSAGAGADTINVSVSGIVSVSGGAGSDTIVVSGTATANVSDLFVGDIFTVAATSFLNATGITSFTASAATTNAAANTAVVLTSAAAGSTINMGAAGGTTGYTITGGVGIDVLSGSAFADLINGGAGADTLTGNAGADTFTFANTATGTPTATNLDTITDYLSATDIIKGPGLLTLVAEGSNLVAGQAAISVTGLATFNAADTTLAQRLIAVEAGMTAATAVANETAIFAVGTDSYIFISDGTAGVGATDVLIKLTGIVAATGLILTAGDITSAA